MDRKQKVVKYAAIVFGILLAGAIVTGIVVLALKGFGVIAKQELKAVDYVQSFAAEEIKEIRIENYDGSMRVEIGDEFKVKGKGVPETFGAECSGEALVVYYTKENSWFSSFGDIINDFSDAEIVITVPEDFVAERLSADNGSGKLVLCGLQVQELKLQNGSGSMTLEDMTASAANLRLGSGACKVRGLAAGQLEVRGGSGRISLAEMELQGLDITTGSGELEFAGAVDGDLEVDTGSGNVTMELSNRRTEYNINVRGGSGGVWLDGEKFSDYGETYEDVENEMNLDTGSGRVVVEFDTK
ncbi:MAG: DUF4097 family beta strand repeat protein [Lachnospiraceae bacterium]|nr:DUF4097 family beta strand repeat protein [Lachnospiraceae bacterium]